MRFWQGVAGASPSRVVGTYSSADSYDSSIMVDMQEPQLGALFAESQQ